MPSTGMGLGPRQSGWRTQFVSNEVALSNKDADFLILSRSIMCRVLGTLVGAGEETGTYCIVNAESGKPIKRLSRCCLTARGERLFAK